MRRVNPVTTSAERLEAVLQALRGLCRRGRRLVGPKDVALEINAPWCFAGGVVDRSTVTGLLRTLCDRGLVERLPRGIQRGLYRLSEEEII